MFELSVFAGRVHKSIETGFSAPEPGSLRYTDSYIQLAIDSFPVAQQLNCSCLITHRGEFGEDGNVVELIRKYRHYMRRFHIADVLERQNPNRRDELRIYGFALHIYCVITEIWILDRRNKYRQIKSSQPVLY